MDEAARRALERLRNPSGESLHALADLVVAEATATPVKDLASPRWIAGQVATALEALTQGDQAKTFVRGRLDEVRRRYGDEPRKLRTFVPTEADDPLRRVLGRPWLPDEVLVHRLLDQPAMRDLVHDVLEDALLRFQKRLRSIDQTGLGSLGMRAARKGRGFLGGLTENLGGVAQNLGGLTENLVGAVAEELEHAVHQRVRDFVGTATGESIKAIARHLSDPQHAGAFGDLRVSALDEVLDTPVRQLVAEGEKLRPDELADVIIGALRSTVKAEGFVERTEKAIEHAMSTVGDGTLGAWLDEVGLRDVWQTTTTELVTDRLKAVVHSERFFTRWDALHR